MGLKELKEKLKRNSKFREEFAKKDLASEVSLILVEARIIRGWTQEELSQVANTTQSAIARAENGKHLPSLSFLQKLADAYDTYLISPRFAFMDDVSDQVESVVGADVEGQSTDENLGSLYFTEDHCSEYAFFPQTKDVSSSSFQSNFYNDNLL